MNKGDKLGELLDKAEAIHAEMKQIFIKNGLDRGDLKLLSPADRDEWYRLKAESDVLEKEIADIFKKNPTEQFL